MRIAATGSVEAVHDLAELISLCAQARADGTARGGGRLGRDLRALLGEDVLDDARAALRELGDASVLELTARSAADGGELEQALAAHLRSRPEAGAHDRGVG